MSRSVTPLSPPRITWLTGLPARSRTGRTSAGLVAEQADRRRRDRPRRPRRRARPDRGRGRGAPWSGADRGGRPRSSRRSRRARRRRRAAGRCRRARRARRPRAGARSARRTRARRGRGAAPRCGARPRRGRGASSSRATSRAQTKGRTRPGEEDLHAARRPERDRPDGERLAELARRDRPARACPTPPTVPRRGSSVTARRAGAAKRSRCTGPGKPMPGRAMRMPCLRHLGRDRLGASALAAAAIGGGVGDAGAVVGDGQLDLGLLQADGQGLGERARRGAREDDLVDLDLHDVAAERWIGAPSGENLLGHRAGGIPGSCAHADGSPPMWGESTRIPVGPALAAREGSRSPRGGSSRRARYRHEKATPRAERGPPERGSPRPSPGRKGKGGLLDRPGSSPLTFDTCSKKRFATSSRGPTVESRES